MFKSTKKWAKELGIDDYNENALRTANVARIITSEIAGYGSWVVAATALRRNASNKANLPPVTKIAYSVAEAIIPSVAKTCTKSFVDGMFGNGVLLCHAVKNAAESGKYESEDGGIKIHIISSEDE